MKKYSLTIFADGEFEDIINFVASSDEAAMVKAMGWLQEGDEGDLRGIGIGSSLPIVTLVGKD